MIKLLKYKHNTILSATLLLFTFFLNGCSSTTPIVKTSKKTVNEQAEQVAVDQTAEEKLALAESLNNLTPTPVLTTQINGLLVEASELFFQQQNFSKALWLANKASGIIKNNYAYTYRLLIVKARSLQALNHHQSAYKQLQLASELVALDNTDATNDIDTTGTIDRTDEPLKLSLAYYLSLQTAFEFEQQPVRALNAQLMAFSLNDNASEQDVFSLWHKLERLNQWQLAQLIKAAPPLIAGWQQLLNYSHRFGANSEQFPRYLRLWQQQYPTHPAMFVVEQLQASILSVTPIENIAVLLPLSGNQKSAGLAAQQGVLAAYENKSSRNIHFIDTNKLDWATLAAQFSDKRIDHVIGPLLKFNVETYLSLNEQEIALQIPSIFLNLPNTKALASYQTAFSMRPEDEAIQAASTLSERGTVL